MCRNNLAVQKHKQQGGALAIGVFVIVVMSLLAAAISGSIGASSEQNNYEVLGTRAKLAAETGLEYMLGQVFPVTGAALSCEPAITQQHYFAAYPGLAQCSVWVTCAQSTATQTYYSIEAKGVCKDNLAGDAGAANVNDVVCANTDRFCVSRRMNVEARTL